jgi:hypothetical protein
MPDTITSNTITIEDVERNRRSGRSGDPRRQRFRSERAAARHRIVAENGWAFFTHDPEIAAARSARGADGRYAAVDGRRALT